MANSNGESAASPKLGPSFVRIVTPAAIVTIAIALINWVIPLLNQISTGVASNCEAARAAVDVSSAIVRIDNELNRDKQLREEITARIADAREDSDCGAG